MADELGRANSKALENFLDALDGDLIHPGLVRAGTRRAGGVATIRAPMKTDSTADYEGAQAQSGILYRLFGVQIARRSARTSARPASRRLSIATSTARRV